MNERHLQQLYRRLGPRSPAGRAGCLTPEALLRLAAGEAGEADRLQGLTHVSTCPACRSELDLARAVVEAGGELVRRPARARWLALAASVVLIAGAVVVWRSAAPPADVMRGAGDVALVAPIGRVAAATTERLVWRAVPGAPVVQFEVEVLDAAGALLYSTATADTAVSLPAGTLRVGQDYRWRVTATRADGTRLRSAAEAFRVDGP